MRESHACGYNKILIPRIQTNFSRLTDNSECNWLKTDFFYFREVRSPEHLRNSLIWLEIGWKSFGNRWPCFEVVENLSTPSVIFGSCREIFGNLWKSSGNLWKLLEIFFFGSVSLAFLVVFRNVRQSFWNSSTGEITRHQSFQDGGILFIIYISIPLVFDFLISFNSVCIFTDYAK